MKIDLDEYEQKYRVDNILLQDFQILMNTLPDLHEYISGGGWDFYYSKPGTDTFQRLRCDPRFPELTKKIKINGSNQRRREYDIKLVAEDPSSSPRYIQQYLEEDGYQVNFSIYKAYDIWVFDEVNYVYYVVFDNNLKELGRFVEVELNKKKVKDIVHPLATLHRHAQLLSKIGLTPAFRETRSLWEMWKHV